MHPFLASAQLGTSTVWQLSKKYPKRIKRESTLFGNPARPLLGGAVPLRPRPKGAAQRAWERRRTCWCCPHPPRCCERSVSTSCRENSTVKDFDDCLVVRARNFLCGFERAVACASVSCSGLRISTVSRFLSCLYLIFRVQVQRGMRLMVDVALTAAHYCTPRPSRLAACCPALLRKA